MVDVGSVASVIGSLKTAADIAKGFLDLKEVAAVQQKVIELQSVILAAQSSAMAAQSEHLTLLEEVRSLKEKMAQLEAWSAEKEKYELKEVFPHNFARSIKPDARGTEPVHLICATCYDRGQKTVLQQNSVVHLECPECKTRIRFRESERIQRDTYGRGGWR